ncbi:prepilin-type N-terminal cleavage/methylation domain-containing protein [Granulosicoccaceae sp. 1_MG-2023]|nr:prepilin-type N-terminal cleavage/methylation domain-containing protein [Granulosicoccaceae sp. 1_MG-2023]
MKTQQGLSLVELLVSVTMAAIIMLGITGVVQLSSSSGQFAQSRLSANSELQHALQRMRDSVARSQRLLLPGPDNPASDADESLRAVLAVTLDPQLDRDLDGWADANNDADFDDLDGDGVRDDGEPQRIDEDSSADANSDGAPGIAGIDDDFDGLTDEGATADDDEDGSVDEESAAADADNDLLIHEDRGSATDSAQDDDGDGQESEDWLDIVVFYLDSGNNLREHLPLADSAGGIDPDTDTLLLTDVSDFAVRRELSYGSRSTVLTISLTLIDEPPLTRQIRAVLGSDL